MPKCKKGKDKSSGSRGEDTLIGGAGNNRVRGRRGDDILWGDNTDGLLGGSDIFVFEDSLCKNGRDTVKDYHWTEDGADGKGQDIIDLKAALKAFRKALSLNPNVEIREYVWLDKTDGRLLLVVDNDGDGSQVAREWAVLEGLTTADFVRIRAFGSLKCISSDCLGNEYYTIKSSQGDTVKPEFGFADQQQVSAYDENQLSEAVVHTVIGASDNQAVTQYRFLYSDNVTGAAVTQDGFFEIDSFGLIKFSAAGADSVANNFELPLNSWVYKVQAGDAAGNWSDPITVTLDEADLSDATPGFGIVNWTNDWFSGTDIFSMWVPVGVNPATDGDWKYYKNGELISDPSGYPIPYGGATQTQGQIEWPSTTFAPGDTLYIKALVNGTAYETSIYTC